MVDRAAWAREDKDIVSRGRLAYLLWRLGRHRHRMWGRLMGINREANQSREVGCTLQL